MRRRSAVLLLLLALLGTACEARQTQAASGGGGGGGHVLWRSEYGRQPVGPSVLGAWQAEQEPAVLGIPQPDRIQLVDRPEKGRVMRVELRPYGTALGRTDGDVTNTGGYEANRAEVYARHHTGSRSAPAAEWPDPIGSTRWYGVDLFIPNSYTADTTGHMWLSLMQWKGALGGQPAIALEVKRDRLELAGASGRDDLGPIARGRWERIVVGVHLHPDQGWVEVLRDGVTVLDRTSRATMQWRSPGVADPIYLKQGLYRDWDWQTTHVVLYGDTVIGTTKDAVLNP